MHKFDFDLYKHFYLPIKTIGLGFLGSGYTLITSSYVTISWGSNSDGKNTFCSFSLKLKVECIQEMVNVNVRTCYCFKGVLHLLQTEGTLGLLADMVVCTLLHSVFPYYCGIVDFNAKMCLT